MIKYDLLNQIIIVINSLCLGALIGLIYDAFSCLEIILGIKPCYGEIKLAKRFNLPFRSSVIKTVILAFFDILYFLIITPICAIFLYSESNGILRWYYVFAVLVGILLYRASIGAIIKRIMSLIGVTIRYCLNFLKIKFIKSVKKLLIRFKKPPKRKEREHINLCSTGASNFKGRAV